MIAEFRLPDLGEGLTEAEVVQWLVQPGDTVALNQTLAEVETAKAVVELPSPYAGTVASLHAEAGETVAVGSPLIAFDVAGDGPDAGAPGASDAAAASSPEVAPDAGTRADADAGTSTQGETAHEVATVHDPATAGEAAADAGEKAQPNLVGYGAAPAAGDRPRRRPRRASAAPAATAADTAVIEAAPHDALPPAAAEPVVGERPRSTPPVRAYAKRRGVDLVLVAAQVGDRLITREDVDAYADSAGIPLAPATAPEPSAAPSAVPALGGPERETRIPIRGVRKHTAQAMVQSAFTAPHVTTFHTVDVTATMDLIAQLKADRALSGHRIGPLVLVAKAVCLALGRNPSLNARWDEEAGEIVQHHYVDLGIAAATERGLIVPNIRDADRMSLTELADALQALAETARAGKTGPAELAGGTFSITNIGVFGIDAGTPILPPGQSGILAVGAVRRQPWEHEGGIALRQVMTLSLSFDHRLVDGAEGGRFLKDVADILEQPGRAMLF
ncbi:dihydrolipoamide acetyltransferase family protein [Microbacterium neungamense]|uniref:dihydrolipoamide acetyltransferase family protein n=1 Tax=Microbacterium neungamense TaxID=2810535 RepID=UPI00217D16C5|nr:dihydrolipoamide acetyltransferase family protein [Microbacterium neungamense]UWF76616.1 2-oxo acid dehydrogenase subunit E2 [Microbacterium neungamense]